MYLFLLICFKKSYFDKNAINLQKNIYFITSIKCLKF